MKLELISFETAVLAKEKGCTLDLFTDDYLYEDEYGDTFLCNFDPSKDNSKVKNNIRREVLCSQPLLQRWLREVHNLHIIVNAYDDKGNWSLTNIRIINLNSWENHQRMCALREKYDGIFFTTYEEAMEIGLQEGLSLIPSSDE